MDTENTSIRFHGRAFVSVISGFSFLAMTFTGAMLFVTPPGRIAHWTGWTLLGLGKEQWAAQHMLFGLVFLVAALIHLCFNWKPLLSYFKDRIKRTFAFRREWVSALVLCIVVFFGTFKEVPPFSSVVALNEHFKQSWDTTRSRPPIAHAELMTLNEVAESINGLEAPTMMHNLKDQGIVVDSADTTLGELARQNQTTPNRLYALATGGQQPREGRRDSGHRGGSSMGAGGGFGRMTLRQFCTQNQLDLDSVLATLKDQSVEADPDVAIRTIADDCGVHPSMIRKMIERD
jgi:hypothetical protein